MVIDEKTRNRLLKFNDAEDTYKQFERKCAYLSRISGMIIKPSDYKRQYEIHKDSIEEYVDIQTELYKFLYDKYPEVDFSMSGRLKSEYSHYEKIIRKFINLIQKDELKPVQILDDYAMKINICSVNYHVDKISVDDEGIYIDSGAEQFRISNPMPLAPEYAKRNKLATDAFEFNYNGRTITVIVEDDKKNILIDNNIPYILTSLDDKEVKLSLNSAVTYKKSFKEDLVPYCQAMQKDTSAFLNCKKFETKKIKDYIKNPKESGYSSIQCSYYSEEEALGIECQTRTYDMELFNSWERKIAYKPKENKISINSLDKVPVYVYTTMFPDGVYSYKMSEAECFEHVYGMSLKEYRKQMAHMISLKEETTR